MLHTFDEFARFLSLVLYVSLFLWCAIKLWRKWTRVDRWIRNHKIAELLLIAGTIFIITEVMLRHLPIVGYRYVVLDVVGLIVSYLWITAGPVPVISPKKRSPHLRRSKAE